MIVKIRKDSSGGGLEGEPVIGEPMIADRRDEDVLDLHDPVVSPHDADAQSMRAVGVAIAGIVALAWTAFALWWTYATIAVLTPVALVEFVAALAAIPVMIGVVCLLALRTSRAEARRFGATARAMRAESASLERTTALVSRTLEANRAQLADQVSALMAMADAAHARLQALGSGLGEEIARVDSHALSLANAAASTQGSLAVLIASLPHAQAETQATASLLEATGVAASAHAAALDVQVAALVERGHEAGVLANGAADRLAGHIERMEVASDGAGARLETAAADMAGTVDALLGRTADAVDESRKGIAAQGEAMLAMVGAHRVALDGAARDSAEALAQRIAGVEAAIDRIAERLEIERHAGDAVVGGLEDGLGRVALQLRTLHEQGVERSQLLAASISALGGSANAMTEALKAGEAMATRTIGTTESLLIALDSAAREIDETLPEALARLDSRIGESKRIVVSAKPELLALVTAAESTHDAIEAIAGVIAEQRRSLEHLTGTLLDTLTSGRSKADALGQMVDETIERTHRFSEDAAPRLIEALLRVRETATVAAEKARETLARVIPEAADALENASAEAMRRATADTVERQVAAITDATHTAVDAATRATERLSRHVQTIADQSAILETRIEDARAERDAADSDTFARRVSLLIESLNSASIDITKAFAPDVSDSAWAAYLKGDRGVFTRRAVRVLEAGDAREVARLYDDDAPFRDQVNRYIHDFEAMLRAILAQRDGSPLGVTLLSSDMGKLYVALAQAIERLR